MNVSNIYRKLKQILINSNIALTNKGFNEVNNLNEISTEIQKLGEINYLPYLLRDEIVYITEEDIRGLTTIGDYAFYNCDSLASIVIPDSVTTIGDSAFDNCSSLASITIPDSVTSIGEKAFQYCNRLKDIYLHATTPPSLASKYAIETHTTIHVPIGSGDAYKSATNWSSRASQIVEDIEDV